MVKIKLVGAGRFMHKRANPNVILRGDEIEVKDELAKALLNSTRTDSLNNVFPMFVVVDTPEVVTIPDENTESKEDTTAKVVESNKTDEPAKEKEPEKPAPAPKASRKKAARARS